MPQLRWSMCSCCGVTFSDVFYVLWLPWSARRFLPRFLPRILCVLQSLNDTVISGANNYRPNATKLARVSQPRSGNSQRPVNVACSTAAGISNDCTCPCRCRGKTVKMIDSRPLQIAMCALVLFDAAVVVAEILLDMHAIRSQSIR